MATPTITVDMNKKCEECGRGGAVASGICISCTTRAIQRKPMKSGAGKAVQARFLAMKK